MKAENSPNKHIIPVVFGLSGMTALLYEVVWSRQLQTLFSSTVYTSSTIFSGFLLGFALGAYWAGPRADTADNPLRLAGWVEVGIGIWALLTPLLLPLTGAVHRALPSIFIIRILLCYAVVVPPALLFGATWPLVNRHYAARKSLGRDSGSLYAVNSVGSALGALIAGFVLVPLIGFRETSLLAAAVNIGIGLLLVRHSAKYGVADVEKKTEATKMDTVEAPDKALLAALSASGMAGLIYEVAWIRPISSTFSSTVYVVSILLGAFMAGLAIGSMVTARHADRIKTPLAAYARLEACIGIYGLLLLTLFNVLPMVTDTLLTVTGPFRYFSIQFITVFSLLVIPTGMMGATFPLAVRGYVKNRVGAGVGRLYAFNTAGAIAGSLLAGLVLLPYAGMKVTVVVAALLNLAAVVIVAHQYHRSLYRMLVPLTGMAFIVLFMTAEYDMESFYSSGVFGINKRNFMGNQSILYYEEGMYGNVMVTESVYRGIGENRLFLSGQGSSSMRLGDVRVSTLLGYLPLMLKPDAHSSMVVGFGVGATSGILARHTKTTSVEIEPKVLETAPFFAPINRGVLQNPNHRVVIDDARGFLAASGESFDIIVNHPLDPYQSFSSLLFTREFYATVKGALNAGGLYVQWMPTYHLGPDDLRAVLATVRDAFPYFSVFLTTRAGERIEFKRLVKNNYYVTDGIAHEHGGEIIVVGGMEPVRFDAGALRHWYRGLPAWDTHYLGMTSLDSERLERLYVGSERDFSGFLENGIILTDNKPVLEFTTPYYKISHPKGRKNVGLDRMMHAVKRGEFRLVQ